MQDVPEWKKRAEERKKARTAELAGYLKHGMDVSETAPRGGFKDARPIPKDAKEMARVYDREKP